MYHLAPLTAPRQTRDLSVLLEYMYCNVHERERDGILHEDCGSDGGRVATRELGDVGVAVSVAAAGWEGWLEETIFTAGPTVVR